MVEVPAFEELLFAWLLSAKPALLLLVVVSVEIALTSVYFVAFTTELFRLALFPKRTSFEIF